MLNVERHAVDQTYAKQTFEFQSGRMTKLIAAIPNTQPALAGVFDASYKLAAAASVIAPEESVLQSAVHTNAQAAAAMFTLHHQKVSGRPMNYTGPIGGSTVQIVGQAPNSSLGPVNYQIGLYCSLISRDDDANHQLCVTPPVSIRRSGVEADEYQYAWISMLGRISRRENLDGAVDAVIAETAPDLVKIATRNHVDATLWLARAAEAARSRNAAAVNDGLAKSLEYFRKVWEEDPKSWQGWLSLGATAIACWALDRGISITVESEYMPSALLRKP